MMVDRADFYGDPPRNEIVMDGECAGAERAEDHGGHAEGPASSDTGSEPAGRDSPERFQHLRMVEALLFAASEALGEADLASQLPDGADAPGLLAELQSAYAPRGVNLVKVAGKWAFRTAPDLGFLLEREREEQRRLSRAALETLAIIAYHQPVTRAEIEQIRGVSISRGTLDVLMETGWVRLRGRRRSPGRPVTYGTTEAFLEHFGLESVSDLPGLQDLKAAGLLDARLPPGFSVPAPSDTAGDEELDPVADGGATEEEADLGYGPVEAEDDAH